MRNFNQKEEKIQCPKRVDFWKSTDKEILKKRKKPLQKYLKAKNVCVERKRNKERMVIRKKEKGGSHSKNIKTSHIEKIMGSE